jgi:hypothetical protein
MIADFESKWDVKINKLSDLEEIAYGKGGNRKLAELADRLIMEIINIVDRFRKDIPYFKDIDDPYYFDENTKSKRNKINEEYNGWKDKATWNAALWIGSDEGLYNQAIEFVSGADRITYTDFLEYLGIETGDKTPDGEYWYEADEKEMTNFLKDFKNDMLDSEGKEREEYEEKKMRKNANNLSEGKYDGEINTLIGVLFGDIGHEKGQYYLYQSLNSASVVKVTGEGGGIDTLLTAYSPKELLNMLEAIRAYKYLHSEDKKEECEKNQIKMRQRVEALSENDANDELNKEIDNIETKINELMRELKLSKEIIKVLYDKLTFEKPKEVDIETDEVISGYYL